MSKWKVQVTGSITKMFVVSADDRDKAYDEARDLFSFNDSDHDLAVDEHGIEVVWIEKERPNSIPEIEAMFDIHLHLKNKKRR